MTTKEGGAPNGARRILIVDDDRDLSQIIKDMLEDYGYEVSLATDGDEAFEFLSRNPYHLILLDINLPDLTGFELCKELRCVSQVPVIFASARTSETDRVTGFDIGGDDYLPKPYSMRELLSRINALLRRAYGVQGEDEVFTFGRIAVDIGARRVTKDGKSVVLSLREFDLLKYLCAHPNQAISKEKLLSEVWGAFSETESSTVTVHIRWLREKLEDDPREPKYIKTVFKVGYMLVETESAATESAMKESVVTESADTKSTAIESAGRESAMTKLTAMDPDKAEAEKASRKNDGGVE